VTPEEHRVCNLEQQIAVLKQKSEDDDKALILAKAVSSALWTAGIALILGLASLLIQLKK
jgi:hypothetical protein